MPISRSQLVRILLLLALLLVFGGAAIAQSDLPPAEIINDEGGAVAISGEVNYTYGFFTLGVDEPLIILEDQAGFVDRNRRFIMSVDSQVLGQITSDFFTSPFTYEVELPIVPDAELRDVDNDGETDTGVMVYAIAYWSNIWGDAYLEERDLQGGGWSGAYASTRISPDPSAKGELIGGKYLVFAPDDQQGFPSGFGEDGKLFTEDDPTVRLPQGYTVVDMDSDPFTFDRSRNPVIDLIEGEGIEQEDYSALSYSEAFDAMIELFRTTYAFTEEKNIDWDAKKAEFRPLFEAAEASG
ncbi:MAG: peptidase S41, partial [Anaerolineae bacterium]|nr:peptidase S41 [Anaerolineae bacterium]